MKTNLVSTLRPHVTYFSAEIPLKAKVSEEVVVGGIIVAIEELGHEFFDQSIYTLILDDGVGTTRVHCSKVFFDHFQSHLTVDSLIVIEGVVNIVSHSMVECSVIAYGLKEIEVIHA